MSDDEEKNEEDQNEEDQNGKKKINDKKTGNKTPDAKSKNDLYKEGSMTSYQSHHSKATQTKSYGAPIGASASRSSPSFAQRTLTVIQDEANQLPDEDTPSPEIVSVSPKASHVSRSTQTTGLPLEAPPPARSVHQMICARSVHGSQPCAGSAQQAGLQRGCCVDEVRQLPGGVIMGCCANTHLPPDKQPTQYLCHKQGPGFPDSVYPTQSGALCCRGTWKEAPAASGSAAAGQADGLGTRSFVGICCAQEPDELSAEITTSVVDLDTPVELDSPESVD